MKIRKSIITLTAALAMMVSPAFADKVGVTVTGDDDLTAKISEALKTDGHELVDIAELTKDVKLDSVAAAEIGKKSGAELIISVRKVGDNFILKMLSTKNDSVQGGVPKDADGLNAMIKELMAKLKEKA